MSSKKQQKHLQYIFLFSFFSYFLKDNCINLTLYFQISQPCHSTEMVLQNCWVYKISPSNLPVGGVCALRRCDCLIPPSLWSQKFSFPWPLKSSKRLSLCTKFSDSKFSENLQVLWHSTFGFKGALYPDMSLECIFKALERVYTVVKI